MFLSWSLQDRRELQAAAQSSVGLMVTLLSTALLHKKRKLKPPHPSYFPPFFNSPKYPGICSSASPFTSSISVWFDMADLVHMKKWKTRGCWLFFICFQIHIFEQSTSVYF